MLIRLCFTCAVAFLLLSCFGQSPAPVVYKDKGSYIAKHKPLMSAEPYDVYIDYNKHALIDMRNKKKPDVNADEEGLNSIRSTVMDLNEVAFDDNMTKSGVFANTSTAPIAKVDGQQDLVAPAVDSGIIIEGDDGEVADSKRLADFRIPLEGGYFHKQSEADRMAGRIYVLSTVSGKVVATADGKVIYVGDRKRGDKLKNYNNLIIVEHNGQTMSIYADVDNIHIKPGDHVKIGEHIADVKKKHGRDFELNFAMRANKKEIINPKDYIKNKP